MFNLEQAITEWRRQMLAAGIKTPVPLEELESHLREEVEWQVQSGMEARQAFDLAVQRVGKAGALGAEFRKVNVSTKRNLMIRTTAILAALFGSVLGGAMVLPALGRWRDTGTLHLGPLVVGCALALMAGCAVIYGVRTHRGAGGRKLIGAFIIAAGIFYVIPLIQAFFMPRIDRWGWVFCVLLAAASILFYGSCFRFIRRSAAPPMGQS